MRTRITSGFLWCGLIGCGLPMDPEGTLDRLHGGGPMRVGVIHNPPWADTRGPEPRGVEVELARRAAAELGTVPDFRPGREAELFEALTLYELDLIIGGVTTETPWKDKAALTAEYHTARAVVGVPEGVGGFTGLKGRKVAVRRDEPLLAALIRDRGGQSVPGDDPLAGGLPAAAGEWRFAQAAGWQILDITLREDDQVWALPPGENGWLLWVEKFLRRNRAEVAGLLEEEAGREAD